MQKIKVYIASPYTFGDPAVNVRRQMDYADKLIDLGFYPFAPLMSHFQHMHNPRPYEQWMEIDAVWVTACDCVLRLSGKSTGADREVKQAQGEGKPVFYCVESLLAYYEATHPEQRPMTDIVNWERDKMIQYEEYDG